MSKFCEYPFTGLFLNTNGDIKFCCAGSFPLGNIKIANPAEVLCGDKAKKIRNDILAGRKTDYCSYCDLVESGGSNSQRLKANTKNFNSSEQFLLTRMDLRWNNTCNLSCIYCNSIFSSKWASILQEKIEKNTEIDDNSLLEFIKEHKEHVESVQLLGGEPLLQKQNIDLIDILPDKKYYILSNMSIDMTNNDVVNKLLMLGDRVTWAVSFESIYDRYEYIRHGSKWETFIENVKHIRSESKRKLDIHATVCIPSALSLLEFCDYVYSSDLFNNIIFQLLADPKPLNIFLSSDQLKSKIIEQINLCVEKYSATHKSDMDQLCSIRNMLQQGVTSKNEIVEFNSWISNLEKKLLNKDNTIYDIWKIPE